MMPVCDAFMCEETAKFLGPMESPALCEEHLAELEKSINEYRNRRVSTDWRPGYYYLHTNGEVIAKPFMVVDQGGGPSEYFDSDFVKKWWRVDTEDEYQLMIKHLKEDKDESKQK